MKAQRVIPVAYYSFLLLSFFLQTGNFNILSKLYHLIRGKAKLKIIVGEKCFFIRDLYDVFGLREVFVDKVYAQLFEELDSKTTFIDLGGYIGDSAVFASDFKNIEQIIVVEPFPDNLMFLKENILLNQLKRIKIIPKAISRFKGSKTFFVHPNRGQSGFNKQNINAYQINVPTTTLAEIIRLVKYPRIILKCDIEGAEYEVFMNTSLEILKKFDRIVFEYHMPQDKLNRLLDHFHRAGFQVSFKKHFIEQDLGNAYCFKKQVSGNFQKCL